MRHCEKSRSLVCRSVMAADMVVMRIWMLISWVLKYYLAKAGEPTGEPRRRKPVVSSAGSGGPRISISFVLVEYLEMASEIEVASEGLIWWRSGSGEWPEVEVMVHKAKSAKATAKIETIADILPHIKDQKDIRVKVEDNGFTVICYMLKGNNTFSGDNSAFALECRGITFRPDRKIAARSMQKFFNVGETAELAPKKNSGKMSLA